MSNYQLSINNYQLPEGYKQTEVGLIPEDWEATTLGDLADVIMGQSPKGNSYNKNGDGVPLINGPTEFTERSPIKVQWTNEPTKLCKPFDLLLCVRGSSTGRMNVANDEFCIGRGVAAIRANSKGNTEYLTYQIHLAIEKLLALSAGSTFPSVDGKAIRSIPVPCPQPEEQREIATSASQLCNEQ
jgi:type I restriction enzyme S subunit